jgi:hypothetical protein
MPTIDRIAQWIVRDEFFGVLPIVVERTAQHDPQTKIDVDQVGRDQLPVDDDARRYVHGPTPASHAFVAVIADLGVVERAPATEHHPPPPDFLIAWQSLVEEIEQIVVQRDDSLHELHILQQPHEIIVEQLHAGDCPHAAGIQGRGMSVPAFHQAEHLAGKSAHLQRLEIERPLEGIERPHDIGNRAITMQRRIRRRRSLSFGQDRGIRLPDHLLAEVHADQIVLVQAMVEHVLGGLAEVDDPFRQRRRAHPKGHVLRVAGARGVVIAADAANATRDEVGIAGILPLHEHAIATEDRRSAIALGHAAISEVDLGVDTQAADDAGHRVPRHLDQFGGRHLGGGDGDSLLRSCDDLTL